MKRLTLFAAIFLVMALGTGCAKSTVALIETNSLCQSWTPFIPRDGDKLTDESAEELLESNEARQIWGCDRLERRAAS